MVIKNHDFYYLLIVAESLYTIYFFFIIGGSVIKNSFIFLEGVSEKREQNLWEFGIHDWDSFLESKFLGFATTKKEMWDNQIKTAQKHLELDNSEFFSLNLKDSEHWRLYDKFKDKCAYIDIETTGLSKYRNSITTLSIWDGKEVKTFVAGQDLTEENLAKEFEKFKMICTFNGKMFDMPFIYEKFPSLKNNLPHLDLRWACRKIGLTGGLKKIEHEMGISRGDLEGVSGRDALRLWRKYKRGDENALDILVRYNQEDVINLETIADKVVSDLKQNYLNEYFS